MQDQLVAKTKYDVANESLIQSAKHFNQTQVDTIEAGLTTVEKMAFYSAGAISLSITFLGYLLVNYKLMLAQRILFTPIYYFLCFSWLLSTLTIICGIATRRFDALYRYWASSKDYFSKKKAERENIIGLVDAKYPLILEDGDNEDSYKKRLNEVIDWYDKKAVKDKKRENVYFKAKMYIQSTAMFSFLLSIIFLIFFAVAITSKILN